MKELHPMNEYILRLLYKNKYIYKDIDGITYMVEYSRSPFWAYERPSLWLFLKEKLCLWHGQVWEILPHGSRVGFGTNCINALFPRRKMRDFLDRESKYVYEACYQNPNSKTNTSIKECE